MGCVGRACEWMGLLAEADESQPSSGETAKQDTASTDETAGEISSAETQLAATMVCVTGVGGCGGARFRTTSQDSEFHDSELRDLSRRIDEMLAPLRNRQTESGLELTFVDTKQGFLLAWVKHPDAVPANPAVSFGRSSAEQIATALGLISFDGGVKAS